MAVEPRIAVVDDEERLARVLAMMLGREGWRAEPFTDPVAFCATLDREPWDLVITDLRMPEIDGLELLDRVLAARPGVPVVLITAHATVDTALRALKSGAYDYLQKPFDNDQVKAVVQRALERSRLSRENRHLRAEVRTRYALDDLVVRSAAMHDVLDLARRAAASRATVLITGDSGTGKERIARAIHYWSDRVGDPFVAINCKALASGVRESELFGHEKGAFTGAQRARGGAFERADGGTLLLDEIGEIDADFQGKLLRVLQEGEVQRVGSDAPRDVDVRVVAATNRDLEREVHERRFREDLYFRLAVIPIDLPPLAERREDVLPLAAHFLERFCREMGSSIEGWSREVEEYLERHDWPGNVRELENAIERAVVLARGDTIELDDVLVGGRQRVGQTEGESLQEHLDRATVRHLRDVLAVVGGRRVEAAERLGIDRTTLYRLMKKHAIE